MTQSGYNIWISCPRPNPQAQLRLFCFPYAGGGASIFRPWAQDLPPEVELCPVQLPGRENRFSEPLYINLRSLVPVLAKALSPYLSRPFAFFGHSMGALLSFELARYLRKHTGAIPVHLFAAGHRAPQLPDPALPTYHLPDPEFIAELQKLNGIPETASANPELMALLLPLLRSDVTLAETYHYKDEPALSCSISAFGGEQDKDVTPEALIAWKEQTEGDFFFHIFSGDHFFLHSHRDELLQIICQRLEKFLAFEGKAGD